MTTRYYTAVLEVAADGGYGVFFPDLPGCTSGGADAQEAATNAAEALALHIAGMVEDGEPLPAPSAPDAPLPADWADMPVLAAAPRILVPVEVPGGGAGSPGITLDEGLLARLDSAAAAEGTTRSGFVAEAVRERLRRRGAEG